jgi:glycosyltransferase involved in cell wall biosynthesis
VTYITSKGGGGLMGVLKRKLRSRFVVEKQIREQLEWADVVVIQESLLSMGLLRLLKKLNKKVIFDFSDPVHLLHLDTGRSLFKRSLFYVTDRRRFYKTLKIASHIVVENESLAVLKSSKSDAVVMRGPIDCHHFSPVAKNNKETVTIGWTGSPSTYSFIEPLLAKIDNLGSKMKLEVVLVGSGKTNVELQNVKVRCVDWSLENERVTIPTFDIGLFNLADTEWDKARGGGKLFVYMACGVPFISPDLGIGRQVYDESGAGVLVENYDNWINTLEQLVTDKDELANLSETARKFALDNYSHESNIETWAKILG